MGPVIRDANREHMNQATRQFVDALRARRRYVIGGFIALILLLVFGLVIDMGNRTMDRLGLIETGTLIIEAPRPQLQITVDGTRRAVSTEAGETITLRDIPTGNHTVYVSHPRLHPWSKEPKVGADTTTTLRPFLVPKEPISRAIARSSTQGRRLRGAIAAAGTPDRADPIVSADGSVAAWMDDGVITARWLGTATNTPAFFCPGDECRETVTVTPTVSPIRNMSFYKDRNDVVIFAARDGVYALEIDPAARTQNFQPLYTGQEPRFVPAGTSTIGVRDENTLTLLSY